MPQRIYISTGAFRHGVGEGQIGKPLEVATSSSGRSNGSGHRLGPASRLQAGSRNRDPGSDSPRCEPHGNRPQTQFLTSHYVHYDNAVPEVAETHDITCRSRPLGL